MPVVIDGTTGITTPGLTNSGTDTLSSGTANGVAYLNGSKVLTTGSALVFDGTNLGLGVTPSAWGSYSGALDFKGNGAIGAFNNSIALFNNSFYNGSNYIYKATTGAAFYQIAGNQHQWYIAPSGTAGNAITWTQAMTLDGSGNFYVGTTSQVGGSNITFYQPNNADLKIAGAVSTATRAVYQVFVNTAVTTVGTENSTGGSLASGTAAYATVLANNGAYPVCFATNNTERGRFTSAGEFWVAGTTDQGAYNIQCNGTGVWGAGAYVNGSDARIKDDIKPLPSSLSVVQNLNPVTFRYKESWSKDTSVQPGFIAQELQQALAGQEYIDGVVMQGPEYMSVAYQTLIPVLTKAIQEQQALIEQLTTRIAALEAK